MRKLFGEIRAAYESYAVGDRVTASAGLPWTGTIEARDGDQYRVRINSSSNLLYRTGDTYLIAPADFGPMK
jgi:hypothetical protein